MKESTKETVVAVLLALVCVGFGYFLRGTTVNVGLAETVVVAGRNQVRAEQERESIAVDANKAIADIKKQMAAMVAEQEDKTDE